MTLEELAARLAVTRTTALEAELAELEAQIATLQQRAGEIRSAIQQAGGADGAAAAGLVLAGFSEQLTLIQGVDAGAAAMLNAVGITAFADIAALTAEDVRELGAKLGDSRRISRQGWIEQAAVLARGAETAHAARVRRGEFAALSVPSVETPPAAAAAATAEAAVKSVACPTPDAAPAPQAVPEAVVIDLSSRRRTAATSRRGAARRWMTLTASMLVVLAGAVTGSGLDKAIAALVGAEAACSADGAPARRACVAMESAAH